MKNKFSRKSLLLVSMTVILATVINLFAGVVAFADDATTTDIIEIESAEELKKIGGTDTNYPADGNYKLVTNVTLSGEWSPLPKFTGMFDGNGYTISGLQITKTYTNTNSDPQIGLFATLSGTATVKNLTLTNVDIEATTEASSSKVRLDVGAIAGGSTDTASISNCKVSGTITVTQTATTQNGRTRIGGILGYAQDKVEYCESNLAITVTSNNANSGAGAWCYVGGIVGQSVSSVAYCVNNGTVTVTSTGTYPAYAGGICGTNVTWGSDANFAVTVQNCVNNGNISATYTNENSNKPSVGAGGILGYISTNTTATLNNNFNFGMIASSEYAGQILGYYEKNPTASENYGITGNGKLVGKDEADNSNWGTTDTKENLLKKQPTHSTQAVGYQTTKATGVTFDLRLVATVDGNYETLTNVGFTVSATYSDVTKTEQTFDIVTLYTGISAEDGTGATVAYTAKELGGDYIFVLACKNLPTNVGDITFTVTTFYTDANGKHINTVQTFTVNSNNIPSADMPEAAA
ncbi:MAG: hypothetical protein J6B71_09785 [Clostridia bacterium]|nr:hypothetical protein [Clostridia bacterium]